MSLYCNNKWINLYPLLTVEKINSFFYEKRPIIYISPSFSYIINYSMLFLINKIMGIFF